MNAPSVDQVRSAPSRDPAITQALGAALKALGSADNENAKLLAVRNFVVAMAPFGRAADEAVLVLRTAATVSHGIALETVQALFEQAVGIPLGMAHVRRSRPPLLPEGAPTASSTVEALMYGLRRGLSCLDDPRNLDRLRRCDEAAVTEIAARLTDMKALSKGVRFDWTEAAVADLLAIWRAVRGQL